MHVKTLFWTQSLFFFSLIANVQYNYNNVVETCRWNLSMEWVDGKKKKHDYFINKTIAFVTNNEILWAQKKKTQNLSYETKNATFFFFFSYKNVFWNVFRRRWKYCIAFPAIRIRMWVSESWERKKLNTKWKRTTTRRRRRNKNINNISSYFEALEKRERKKNPFKESKHSNLFGML